MLENFLGIMNWVGSYVFYYPIIMSLVWVIGGLFFYCKKETGTPEFPKLRYAPFISALIPARNEAGQLEETVRAVLASEYPNLEIIIIDDASTDGTGEIADYLAEQHEMVRVVHLKQNMGKANGLNNAFLASKGEIIFTIDADCLIDKPALYWVAWHFVTFPRVGAVTGNPHVRNRTSLLAQLQTAEYTSVIGLIKRTQRILGKLLTISGVIGAFRREALIDVGLWSPDMVTEDIDITWKLEMRFWDVRYEANAVGWILVPETFRGLWRQRLRWAQGSIETIRRHRNVWADWRQRRIWPVYIDYVLSIIWSYAFFASIIFWLAVFLSGDIVSVYPIWNGCVIAIICLTQFIVSISINLRYDRKLAPTYFWVVWYPVFYWMFNAVATAVALPIGLRKKFGKTSLWVSPDRGIAAKKKVWASKKSRNKIINAQEKMTGTRRGGEVTIKVLFSFILTFFAILSTVALWGYSGKYLYENLFTPEYFEQTVEILFSLLLVSLLAFMLMLLWQQYNLRVFGSKKRRSKREDVPDERLADMYVTTLGVIDIFRQAKTTWLEYSLNENTGNVDIIGIDENERPIRFAAELVKP